MGAAFESPLISSLLEWAMQGKATMVDTVVICTDFEDCDLIDLDGLAASLDYLNAVFGQIAAQDSATRSSPDVCVPVAAANDNSTLVMPIILLPRSIQLDRE